MKCRPSFRYICKIFDHHFLWRRKKGYNVLCWGVFVLSVFLSNSGYAAKLYKEEQPPLGQKKRQYFVSLPDLPKMTVERHYKMAEEAFAAQSWEIAAKHFRIVKLNFFDSPLAHDAIYFLAVSYYNNGDLDLANQEFSNYLSVFLAPKYFQETIEYKFAIADAFKNGVRRHMFGVKSLPKLFTAKALSVEIYDEVIAALPADEYAVRALYAKGEVLRQLEEYRESVDAFQTLIKRFPRHELAPESYLAITKVYIDQSLQEFQNPDLITFSEINLRKFSADFPREERIAEMQQDVCKIKEIYAQGLCDTGKFYERTGKHEASMFYYNNVLEKFGGTQAAKQCREQIAALEMRLKKRGRDNRDPRFKNRRIKYLSKKHIS